MLNGIVINNASYLTMVANAIIGNTMNTLFLLSEKNNAMEDSYRG